MSYKPDMTWEQWEVKAAATSSRMINAVTQAEREYEEWNRFQGGQTPAQLALKWGRTEAEINEMIAVYGGCKEQHDHANNQPVTQGDRLFAWRQFGG